MIPQSVADSLRAGKDPVDTCQVCIFRMLQECLLQIIHLPLIFLLYQLYLVFRECDSAVRRAV
jgi:hypothetical protein